ncbi:response regulator [Pseudomonas syringae group genomosp. 3]|uniref:response regulator n=1 Tax=Pseudomonas syringae group genomosp. 3 TaxID=251701 RepID=UPI000F00BDA1|nr:response regulator [Pseudomonas syringae group genomosp. 3]RMP68447.1 hypothetical protein ALQ19_200102 [Pseudomonas syringae pv. berberidis]
MSSTILVVEDDDMLRWLMLEALMTLNETLILECNSADAAWLMLEHSPGVNLVITDIRMPGKIDGWELAKRCWDKWPAMPIIITSGHLRVTAGELPVGSSFMAKPWTLDHLYEMVDHHLPAA